MRKLVILTLAVMVCLGMSTVVSAGDITKDQVVGLVEKVTADIKMDASATIDKIIKAMHPYKNKDNPAHYVFVYDTDVIIVAHPKKTLVGRSYKGKPDVRGKKFRDDIVAGALDSGTGWVDYSYQKPGAKGIHKKTTFFKLVEGSDGKKYVVCSGKYL